MISLLLEEVSSSAITSLTKPVLLMIGLFVGAISLLTLMQSFKSFVGGGIVAACFIIAHLVTQKRILAFASAGAAIEYAVGDTSDETCHDFLEAVEQAKYDRHQGLALKKTL